MNNEELIAAQFLEELQFRALLEIGMRPDIQEEVWKSQYNKVKEHFSSDTYAQNLKDEGDSFQRFGISELDRLHALTEIMNQMRGIIPEIDSLTTEKLSTSSLSNLHLPQDKIVDFMNLAVPTRYEHPLFYKALLAIKPLVDKAFSNLGHSAKKNPLIGTLPHGEVHARLMPVPDSDRYLVLFNNGWFGFLLRAVSIFFRYMSFSQVKLQEEANSRIESDSTFPEIAKLFPPKEKVKIVAQIDFINLIGDYLLKGDPSKVDNYFDQLPSSIRKIVATQYLTPIQIFVMSHEYGHLALGHIDDTSISSVSISSTTYKVYETNWSREFDADAEGFRIAMKIAGGNPQTSMFAMAIDIYFAIVDLLEKSRHLLLKGELPLESEEYYPPITQRQQRIRKQALEYMKPNPTKHIENSYQASDHVHNQFWTFLEPTFMHLHQNGERPAELWKRSLLHLFNE